VRACTWQPIGQGEANCRRFNWFRAVITKKVDFRRDVVVNLNGRLVKGVRSAWSIVEVVNAEGQGLVCRLVLGWRDLNYWVHGLS
jgi:hypothetical protein